MTDHDKLPTPGHGPIQPDTATPKRTTGQRLFALTLIVIILTCGLVAGRLIIASKPKAERKQRPKMQTLVQVIQVTPKDIAIQVEAMGTVLPAREMELKPRVSGTVLQLNPGVIPGGLLKKGEVVATLDPQDYQIQVERSRSNLEKALMDLRLEEGNQAVAKREYELIQSYSASAKDAPKDLALRRPQLAKARANEAVARTELQQARLNLERTKLKAPFNAIILNKEVAPGSQVTPQTRVVTLAGTDVFWVRVSLPHSALAMIDLPTPRTPGPEATFTSLAGTTAEAPRKGTVIRLLSEVDPKGLMARLLIEVRNPMQQDNDRLPLLLGSMVRAHISGKILPNCYQIPRKSIRADSTLLLATNDNTLTIRQVTVAWQDKDYVYITQGLKPDDMLITSSVPAPIVGMKLKIRARERKGTDE